MSSGTLYLKIRWVLNRIGVSLEWIVFFLMCELICGLSKLQELMLLNSKSTEKSFKASIFRKFLTTTSQTSLKCILGIVFGIPFIIIF